MKQQDLLIGSPGQPAPSRNNSLGAGDRRKSVRFAVSATADMLELSTRTRLSGRASDLGADGCYVDTVTPFPVGTSLMLTLTSENHHVQAKANVVYAHTGMGMSLAFAEMTANQKENLSVWLRELGGELPKSRPLSRRICRTFRSHPFPSQLPARRARVCSTRCKNLCLCLGTSEC